MKSYDATLEDWKYGHHWGAPVVWGFVYGDTKLRFRDGTWIHTSLLPENLTLKEGDLLQTLNTVYLLGKPYSEEDTP